MNINYNKLFDKLLPFFILFTTAYIISFIIYLYLPKKSVTKYKNSSLEIDYKNYKSLFKSSISSSIEKEKVTNNSKEYKLISNIELKAVYAQSEYIGWIILEDKNNKTYILENDEKFRGYILRSLYKNYVVFEKNNKKYRLKIKENSNNLKYSITNEKTNENIEVNNDVVKVKRAYLNDYISDFEKIWKDIKIKDARKNGKIIGFKVLSIKKGSVFMKLGLEKDDIIKSINNKKLNSYNDAFAIYKKINDIDYLEIEVLRNQEIVELSYEIN